MSARPRPEGLPGDCQALLGSTTDWRRCEPSTCRLQQPSLALPSAACSSKISARSEVKEGGVKQRCLGRGVVSAVIHLLADGPVNTSALEHPSRLSHEFMRPQEGTPGRPGTAENTSARHDVSATPGAGRRIGRRIVRIVSLLLCVQHTTRRDRRTRSPESSIKQSEALSVKH